jgi:sec-independent protein translocase protein TatA
MFSGLESPMHLLIVLVIAVLVLGPKKLPEVGRSLGSGIRGFKASIEGHDEHPAEVSSETVAPTATVAPSATVAPAATVEKQPVEVGIR